MMTEELDKRYEQMNKVFAQRIDKDWCDSLQTEDDILRESVRLTEEASIHFVQSLLDEREPNDTMKKAVEKYKQIMEQI